MGSVGGGEFYRERHKDGRIGRDGGETRRLVNQSVCVCVCVCVCVRMCVCGTILYSILL